MDEHSAPNRSEERVNYEDIPLMKLSRMDLPSDFLSQLILLRYRAMAGFKMDLNLEYNRCLHLISKRNLAIEELKKEKEKLEEESRQLELSRRLSWATAPPFVPGGGGIGTGTSAHFSTKKLR